MRTMIREMSMLMDVMAIAILGRIGLLFFIQDELLEFFLSNVKVLWMPIMVVMAIAIFNGGVVGKEIYLKIATFAGNLSVRMSLI